MTDAYLQPWQNNFPERNSEANGAVVVFLTTTDQLGLTPEGPAAEPVPHHCIAIAQACRVQSSIARSMQCQIETVQSMLKKIYIADGATGTKLSCGP